LSTNSPETVDNFFIIETWQELAEHIREKTETYDIESSVLLRDLAVWQDLNTYYKDTPEIFAMLGLKGVEISYFDHGEHLEADLTLRYEMFMNVLRGTNMTPLEHEVHVKARQIISTLTFDQMNPLEKAEILHKYLAQSIDYDHNHENNDNAFNVYGAMAQGLAVCQGYAQAFQMLLTMAGIESIMVTGVAQSSENAEPENHAWNLVKLDDNRYHIDITWNDREDGFVSHRFFGVTDEQLAETHTWNRDLFPAATSTEHNYYRFYGLVANSADELSEVFEHFNKPDFIEILCTFDVIDEDLYFLENFHPEINIEQVRYSITSYGNDKLLTLVL
jgi:hypothetical protein